MTLSDDLLFKIETRRYDSSELGPKFIYEKSDWEELNMDIDGGSIKDISCKLSNSDRYEGIFDSGVPEGMNILIDIIFTPTH